MNFFIFVSLVLILSFIFGKLLEKIHIPWIFTALLIGSALAIKNPFENVTSSETFELFANIGMYLLLFLVGFEIDMKKLKSMGAFIFGSAIFIIFLEGIVAAILVHFLFGYSWVVSLLISLSFATVGEVILIPILHEFKLVNTDLGQMIIGIGTADDVIEILLLIFTILLVGQHSKTDIFNIVLYLGILFLLTTSFRVFKKSSEKFKFANIETIFLFIISVFFLFIGVGAHADAAPIAAILSGISVRLFITDDRLELVDTEIKSFTYGLFAPLFFVWAGLELNINYLMSAPLMVLLIVIVSNGLKVLGSLIIGKKRLGTKGSVLLGIGLSVQFSTSILVMKYILDKGLIDADIYSVVIVSGVIFNFVVPLLFSLLSVRWGFSKEETEVSSIV